MSRLTTNAALSFKECWNANVRITRSVSVNVNHVAALQLTPCSSNAAASARNPAFTNSLFPADRGTAAEPGNLGCVRHQFLIVSRNWCLDSASVNLAVESGKHGEFGMKSQIFRSHKVLFDGSVLGWKSLVHGRGR